MTFTQFIFFKGLENVSVCRCVCVHMCARLRDPPSSAWRISLLCRRAVQTRRWGGGCCLGHTIPHMGWPLRCTLLWKPSSLLPVLFHEKDRNFRSSQLCVWQRSLFKAPGASPHLVVARTDKAHCYSSFGSRAKASRCWAAAFHWCSQFVNCWENACTCYIGVKWEAGIRKTIPLIQKDCILSARCYPDR